MTKSRKQSPVAEEARPPRREATYRPAARPRQRPKRHGQRSVLYSVMPAFIVVALGVGGLFYFFGNDTASNKPLSSETAALLADVTWPTYVSRGSAPVKEAYQFAVERPGVLEYMPCFCGCKNDGHKSNKDCFIADYKSGGSTIAFDRHGAT